jgi:hypothetical protein
MERAEAYRMHVEWALHFSLFFSGSAALRTRAHGLPPFILTEPEMSRRRYDQGAVPQMPLR